MKKTIISATLISIIAISGCSGERAARELPKELFAQSNSVDESKVIDLTYNFDEATIYWPTAQPFLWEKESWGVTEARFWYAAARYSASEHGGTHIDSPIHFGQGKSSIDQIPLSRLIGPAAVIDIVKACEKDPDYRLTAEDINAWENINGRIPDESIVLVRTGWGKFWTDKKRYMGTDAPGDVANLHFPGISREAADFLSKQRRIDGIGIDTASLDHGPSQDFIAHQILNGANIYGLENIAKLDQLPAQGATLIALPMKIKGGTGGPARIIAILP